MVCVVRSLRTRMTHTIPSRTTHFGLGQRVPKTNTITHVSTQDFATVEHLFVLHITPYRFSPTHDFFFFHATSNRAGANLTDLVNKLRYNIASFEPYYKTLSTTQYNK